MWVSKVVRALDKVLNPVSYWTAILGGVALVVVMLTVVIDVTLRAGFAKGIWGNIEIVGLSLIIVFFAGYAYTQIKQQHIQVDVVVGRLPSIAQKIINTNAAILVLGISIIISWQFFDQALYLKDYRVMALMLDIPKWPFMMAASFFIALFALVILRTILAGLAELLTAKPGINGYLWLLPGIMAASALFVFVLRPDLMPFEFNRTVWGAILFAFLFVLIFLKVHIGTGFAIVALLGVALLNGTRPALVHLGQSPITVAGNYAWSVAPLFILMGVIIYETGFAKELYYTTYKWIGHLPGGLASATTVACAGLGAITGSMITGVLTMGVIALPEMRKYKYDMKLATASICAASPLGGLIPPSIDAIIYAMITGTSIGKLFIAGIFPGLLLTTILVLIISIRCRLNPALGPPGPKTPLKEKMVSLKDVWAVVLLVLLTLGGLYAGIFTPTEAGAIGAFGAIVISWVRRRLTFTTFSNSVIGSLVLTSAIFFIFIFANTFIGFLAITRIPNDVAEWIIGLGLSGYAVIILILLIYTILGCIMNTTPAIILSLPILFPIAMSYGFDPVWFGVLIVVMSGLGQITPPIGMVVFAMSAIAKDVPMYDIFKGTIPFYFAFLILLIFLILFPQISLFLPNLMG